MRYPNGVLIEHDQIIYKVSGDKLHPLLSWRAALSWHQPIVPAEIIYDYEISTARLGFRSTTLVQSVVSGSVYFIDGSKKRLIATPDFWELGFNKFEIIVVSQEELDFHIDGEPII